MQELPEQSTNLAKWYAVVTVPRHERTASSYLSMAGVETFLPAYDVARTWKNRQRVVVSLPLFPTYLFVRITHRERIKVLSAPGIRKIVGNSREPLPLADEDVDSLRKAIGQGKVEPYPGLVAGRRVRVTSGMMKGAEGYLVRQGDGCRFVISVQLINQSASIEVDALVLEPVAG